MADKKVAICTLYTPEIKSYAIYGLLDKQRYASTHNYDLFIEHKSLCSERPASWSKLLMVKEKLPDYDWVWWVDIDTLIMDHTRRLDPFISHPVDMMVGVDKVNNMPNCGVWFMQNTPNSKIFLDTWWNTDENIFDPIWEQRAFFDLVAANRIPQIGFCDARAFNTYWSQWEPGQFLAHFTGTKPPPNTEERAVLMKQWQSKRKLLDQGKLRIG